MMVRDRHLTPFGFLLATSIRIIRSFVSYLPLLLLISYLLPLREWRYTSHQNKGKQSNKNGITSGSWSFITHHKILLNFLCPASIRPTKNSPTLWSYLCELKMNHQITMFGRAPDKKKGQPVDLKPGPDTGPTLVSMIYLDQEAQSSKEKSALMQLWP